MALIKVIVFNDDVFILGSLKNKRRVLNNVLFGGEFVL